MANKCGYKRVRSPDDIQSGHIEYETVTLCGEDLYCGDECYLLWTWCPYCRLKFDDKQEKQNET